MSIFPLGIFPHPSASRIPLHFLRVSGQFRRPATGDSWRQRAFSVSRRCPLVVLAQLPSLAAAPGDSSAQRKLPPRPRHLCRRIPKGSLLVAVDREGKELRERWERRERERAESAWLPSFRLGLRGGVTWCASPERESLKKKESPSLVSFAALAPLGDGVHASDFHQSSIK